MRILNVLVGCEESGVVRNAFTALGHNAWSCDLMPTRSPGNHYQCDIREVLTAQQWNIFIVHPECTYMANSGALRLYVGGKKENGIDTVRWGKMVKAAEFAKEMLNAPVEYICLENPIMLGYAQEIVGIKHTQVIQPWKFGEDASKATCLWLKNLPPLKSTKITLKPLWIPCPDGCDEFFCTKHRKHTYECSCPEIDELDFDPYVTGGRYANQTPSGQNNVGPSPTRQRDRSVTYPGIAKAMAEQWSQYVLEKS